MNQAMGELELYLNSDEPTAILIKCGLAHGQFEMIHPFLDGNGRLGRLLIIFLLCQQKVLTRPLLFLIAYFKRNQREYYRRLLSISDSGDWEGWLKYFLKGVGEIASESAETARLIMDLREEHRKLVLDKVRGRQNGLVLLDNLFEMPVITVTSLRAKLGVSTVTANNLVNDLAAVGILQEITQRNQNRIFTYQPYLDILNRDL